MSIEQIKCFRIEDKEILLRGYEKGREIGETVTFKQCVKGWLICIHK